ncbi:MAG: TonB-dependent receptor [Lachnoclostridium sp.]|nr:TonB-dependent receptor [Lachnoclostridium sp.]
MKTILCSLSLLAASFDIYSQGYEEPDTTFMLDEVVAKAPAGYRKLRSVANTELITAQELTRAACCNLGESFTTNPSVDVNYSDAATGARQIRLLGLAGTYVQMLNENIPAMRGAAAPYGLSYIPGTWIQSMQVSKGAASVKNGYESITGQINIELKKPQVDPSLSVNMYYDSENKLEANVGGNLHLGKKWSAGLLTHFEQKFTTHDGDDDGFIDMPKVRQINLMPRVAYLGSSYVFQAALKVLDERRESGQDSHHFHPADGMPRYTIDIKTTRLEAFTKNAFIFDRENDGNIALIVSGSYHDSNSDYGMRLCDILERTLYSQLMFERKWNEIHAISVGATFNYDNYHYRLLLNPDDDPTAIRPHEHEAVTGGYAQYTLNLDEKLIAMGGVRYDFSSHYGSMFTPRVHLRYNPSEVVSLHASAGRGYHSPRPYAEYSYLLASSRRFDIVGKLRQESAWNMGGGTTLSFHPFDRALTFSAEYYFTDFTKQTMVDLDADPHAALIFSSANRFYSHSLQLEVNWEAFDDFNFSAAWRLNDVKVDYGRGLQQKPLISRNKALFTLNYAPNMGIWQFDISCAINGSGVMPTPYVFSSTGQESWSRKFKAYPTLNAHITRNFRHWSIYIGGENLTGYRQKSPIIGASDPWGKNFDATMIYGPLHGAMFYAGFRYNITKYL